MPPYLRPVGILLLVAAGGAGGWFLVRLLQDAQTADPVAGPSGPGNAGPAAMKRGKLVVLVVFDQFRGDYLERWATAYGPDGFERIKKGGVWYADAQVPYACTATAPGHASLVTGAAPSRHGIIENDWYDRKAGKRTYCIEPTRPFARVPGTMSGARGQEDGVSPEKLLVPAVGDALVAASGGKSKVFSLSIKDRTAVLMGGRKPTGVYSFDNRNGEFYTSAFYREKLHPWVAEFNASGAADKWYGTKWERLRPELSYDDLAGPDDAPGEARGFFGQGRVFPHPMQGKEPGKNAQYYTILETSPFGSELLLQLAEKAIAAENLGRGDASDLLCVSFSSNDLIGHFWGPNSWEVLDVSLRSDRIVARLLKYLDDSIGKDKYTLVMTADHGVCPVPESNEQPGAVRVAYKDLQEPLEAALTEAFGKAESGPTRWLEPADELEQVWPWFYLNDKLLSARVPATALADYRRTIADFAAQWIGNRPYGLVGFTRQQIETDTLPTLPPEQQPAMRALLDRVKLAYHPDRCGDVIAITKPNALVSKFPAGTGHGSPHPYDSHVPVVVYGAGVPALGRVNGRVSSLIVAPTLAWALGIAPPEAAAEKVPKELKPTK